MAKRARFGDWTKGIPTDVETWNVSYEFDVPGGPHDARTIKIKTDGGKRAAGRRVYWRLRKRFPSARITIRKLWREGETPSGLHLPKGYEWVDDEVGGKGKTSR